MLYELRSTQCALHRLVSGHGPIFSLAIVRELAALVPLFLNPSSPDPRVYRHIGRLVAWKSFLPDMAIDTLPNSFVLMRMMCGDSGGDNDLVHLFVPSSLPEAVEITAGLAAVEVVRLVQRGRNATRMLLGPVKFLSLRRRTVSLSNRRRLSRAPARVMRGGHIAVDIYHFNPSNAITRGQVRMLAVYIIVILECRGKPRDVDIC